MVSMDNLNERIETLERDCSALQEALKALVLNDLFCIHNFGAMCVTGNFGNGEKSYIDLGIYFYHKGAMLGDIECQYDYAMMLYRGEHMPQNKQKALYWFKKIVENTSANGDCQVIVKKNAQEMYEIIKAEK